MSSYISGNKSYLSALRNIFRVSAGSVFFQSFQLTSLSIMTLFVYGLYNLYISLVWFLSYPTMIALNFLSAIWFLNLSRLMSYTIRLNYKNKPMILIFFPNKISEFSSCTIFLPTKPSSVSYLFPPPTHPYAHSSFSNYLPMNLSYYLSLKNTFPYNSPASSFFILFPPSCMYVFRLTQNIPLEHIFKNNITSSP